MRLLPSDPDIETIVSRIKSGDIDLQPDFQRGEVWSKNKKQRLIDSILRDWHVPPIHVIEDVHSRKQEVLDGQQRLVAIRDFIEGEFALDGMIEPIEFDLEMHHGMKYWDLPDAMRRRFNQFTIRLFRIVDYKPGEPGELFFRLNQPTSLTGAEQRNAFFGPIRSQIKNLVETLDYLNLDKDFLGFSNSRMAYDDVLARVALTIERGSLEVKVTSSDLIELYRSESPLHSNTISLLSAAIHMLAELRLMGGCPIKFNKATLSTWLLFIVRCELRGTHWFDAVAMYDFMSFFSRKQLYGALEQANFLGSIDIYSLFSIYESRSSSRVADVSSVILRDAIIWVLFYEFLSELGRDIFAPDMQDLLYSFGGYETIEDDIASKRLMSCGWGRLS